MFQDRHKFAELIPRYPPQRLSDLNPGLKMFGDERLEIWYAPLPEPVHDPAVWVLGLTPGWTQTQLAYQGAAEALVSGASVYRAAVCPKPSVAFAGTMRTNLIGMLDELGMARALGAASMVELFGSNRLRTGSALRYPVFSRGRNYSGHSPSPTKHPALLAMLDEILADELDEANDCLIVPLGRAVEECLRYSIAKGRLEPSRVLFGFPHPSGANGHRKKQFCAERHQLAARIDRWAGVDA